MLQSGLLAGLGTAVKHVYNLSRVRILRIDKGSPGGAVRSVASIHNHFY